jgi:glycosyltransferase involved in cell wall biosynthesis
VRPIHVLQLGPFPPPHGGVQTNIVAIRDLLRASGHECSVINLTRFRRPDGDGVFYPDGPAGVIRLLFKRRYDVVHLHLGGRIFPRLLAMAFLCTIKPRAKSVLTFHSGGYARSPEGRSAGYWTLRGFVFRRFDRIVAVNSEIVELFKRFGVDPRRIKQILPHALPDVPRDLTLPEPLESFFAAHSPVMLTVGLLEPEYDLALQIQALADLRKSLPRAGLVIAGSGSLHAALQSTIAAAAHGSNVLLYGDMPHEITLRAMVRSDVFLRTTLYDGDSIAVRETLHLRVPVVATDNGMRPPGVRLIPIGDRQALCAAVQDCLRSRTRAPVLPGTDAVQEVLDMYQDLQLFRPASTL